MKRPCEPSDLREHAVETRVERVWERLEGNLAGELGRGRTRRSATRTSLYVAAALAAGFAGGVGVASSQRSPVALTVLAEGVLAERGTRSVTQENASTTPIRAAGQPSESAHVAAADRSLSSAPVKSGARVTGLASRSSPRGGSANGLPAWTLACANYDYDKAYELLEADGGVAGALQVATNDQRLCLASGSRQRNQPEVAKVALQGVAEDSTDPDRAAIAAAQLARIFEEEGNVGEQRRYEQLKEIRSKGRLLSESALCEKVKVQAEVGAHRPEIELARQYENQDPSGTCAATVQALETTAKAKLVASLPVEPVAGDSERPSEPAAGDSE